MQKCMCLLQRLGDDAARGFGAWDAAGAKWFGFPTFWVNRLGVPPEELPPGPDATGRTLSELAAFVEGW